MRRIHAGRLVLMLAWLVSFSGLSSATPQPASASGDSSGLPAALVVDPATQALLNVAPVAETMPVEVDGDAADDPAIWIHPVTPALSTIIGTNKNNALEVYSLEGTRLQSIPEPINNIDIRYNFPLRGRRVALVVGQNKQTGMLAAYQVNPVTRLLENVAARDIEVYGGGVSLYHSPFSGKYYYFSNKRGKLWQYELTTDSAGLVGARLVRTVEFGTSHSEGVVADDVFGVVYVSDENAGIWKLYAEPDGGSKLTLIDKSIDRGGHLAMDVEGLTIYYTSNRNGYLIASSQGNDTFNIYERLGNNRYLASFTIGPGNGIDGVTHTDGIDVTNVPLGPAFPHGLFVAQDDRDDSGTQNFKLVRWDQIARAGRPQLAIDTHWDPRMVGAP